MKRLARRARILYLLLAMASRLKQRDQPIMVCNLRQIWLFGHYHYGRSGVADNCSNREDSVTTGILQTQLVSRHLVQQIHDNVIGHSSPNSYVKSSVQIYSDPSL